MQPGYQKLVHDQEQKNDLNNKFKTINKKFLFIFKNINIKYKQTSFPSIKY